MISHMVEIKIAEYLEELMVSISIDLAGKSEDACI